MLTHLLLLPCAGVGDHMLGLDMPSLTIIDPGRGRQMTQPEAVWASEPALVEGLGKVRGMSQHH